MSRGNKEKNWNPKVAAARKDSDLFPTEEDITLSFLMAEAPYLCHFEKLHECACGEGAMAKIFKRLGFKVVATDLRKRGYGRGQIDFLKVKKRMARAIVTNPPYNNDLPEKFLRHAQDIGYEYVAMLLKADYFNSYDHALLWRDFRPVREYKITWRRDFLGLGGGRTNVCFYVWDFRKPTKQCTTHLVFRQDKARLLKQVVA